MPLRCRRSGVLAVAFLAAAGVVVWGARRRPTGASEGGPLEPAPATRPVATTAPSRLRLASFNIHSGVGTDGRLDLGRVAGVLRGCDLDALQEVRGAVPWRDHDEARALGELLGAQSLFLPSERQWWRRAFGNAVLTDTRITHWRRTPLPHDLGRASRNMTRLEVPFGCGVLNVLVTHLSTVRNGPSLEFRALRDAFLNLPTPAVLMGDMNRGPDDPEMSSLLETPGVQNPLGKRRRFDYILLRGVRWRDAGVVENDASDHPMVWVEIES